MKNRFIVLATFAAAALVLEPAMAASQGDVASETRNLSGFHRIDVQGEFDVTLVQGSTESVTIEAPASVIPKVVTEVHNGTLSIAVRSDRGLWNWLSGRGLSKPVRLTINLRELDFIEGAGAFNLEADTLKVNELRLDIAGASKLRIRDLQAKRIVLDGSGTIKAQIGGSVARQDIDISGAGAYDAGQLVSDEVVVDMSGAGKAVVHAKNTLSVDISGAGVVEYIGDPKLRQTISGIGKVRRKEGS
jgi:hypothetical protein